MSDPDTMDPFTAGVAKIGARTAAEVEAARCSVYGCCNRNADQKACDCLKRAEPDVAPGEPPVVTGRLAYMIALKGVTAERDLLAARVAELEAENATANAYIRASLDALEKIGRKVFPNDPRKGDVETMKKGLS